MKNKYMKLMCIALASLLFPFCASCNSQSGEGKLKIVTTIFPEYDWVMNILGDKKNNADVTLLLDSGIDLHSYQPTPKDIVTISNCDLFVYVGGESDNWVNDALKQSTNKNLKAINLLETLGDKAKEEEVVEGMEGEEEEEESEEEEEKEYDEHVWLSLKNAEIFVKEINKVISELDVENADYYSSNTTSYVNSLKDLDNLYTNTVKDASIKTLLFADRFPFRYLVDDYGLSYFAAFIGCSAETEASFETVKFLANKVDELGLKVILKIESSDGKIANTVKNATQSKDQSILTMDSIQSATTNEYNEGRNYLSIMQKNLDVLKEAIK